MKIKVKICDSNWEKFIGLMGKKRCIVPLLLMSCSRIHTYFMRFSIDAVYLSHDFFVLAIQEDIKPWKLGNKVNGCGHILEMESGSAKMYRVGEKVDFDFMNKN